MYDNTDKNTMDGSPSDEDSDNSLNTELGCINRNATSKKQKLTNDYAPHFNESKKRKIRRIKRKTSLIKPYDQDTSDEEHISSYNYRKPKNNSNTNEEPDSDYHCNTDEEVSSDQNEEQTMVNHVNVLSPLKETIA